MPRLDNVDQLSQPGDSVVVDFDNKVEAEIFVRRALEPRLGRVVVASTLINGAGGWVLEVYLVRTPSVDEADRREEAYRRRAEVKAARARGELVPVTPSDKPRRPASRRCRKNVLRMF